MPTYVYENRLTKKQWTEILPVHKRDFPCRNPMVRRVITAPNIAIISDNGGKEDKAREQIMQSVDKAYKEQDVKDSLGIKKIPEKEKEKREKKKQKRKWL